jgi:capsular polysaccharide transport system permease protein
MNISTIDHETLRQVVRKSRQNYWLVKHRWLALFVGIPTLIATAYYGFIASPIYVSQSSFVIKSPGQKAAPSLSLANLVQTTGFSAGQEQTTRRAVRTSSAASLSCFTVAHSKISTVITAPW